MWFGWVWRRCSDGDLDLGWDWFGFGLGKGFEEAQGSGLSPVVGIWVGLRYCVGCGWSAIGGLGSEVGFGAGPRLGSLKG